MKITEAFHQKVRGFFPNRIVYSPQDTDGVYYSEYYVSKDPISGWVIMGTPTWDSDGSQYEGDKTEPMIVAWAYRSPKWEEIAPGLPKRGFGSEADASEICDVLNSFLKYEEEAHWLPDPNYDFEVMNWTRT